jgi:hypothetical protein
MSAAFGNKGLAHASLFLVQSKRIQNTGGGNVMKADVLVRIMFRVLAWEKEMWQILSKAPKHVIIGLVF